MSKGKGTDKAASKNSDFIQGNCINFWINSKEFQLKSLVSGIWESLDLNSIQLTGSHLAPYPPLDLYLVGSYNLQILYIQGQPPAILLGPPS